MYTQAKHTSIISVRCNVSVQHAVGTSHVQNGPFHTMSTNKQTKMLTEPRKLTSLGLFSHSCINRITGLSKTLKTITWIALMLAILDAVEDPDVGKLRTIAQEATDHMRWHDFGCKAFWDSNPELSCLKLNLD